MDSVLTHATKMFNGQRMSSMGLTPVGCLIYTKVLSMESEFNVPIREFTNETR